MSEPTDLSRLARHLGVSVEYLDDMRRQADDYTRCRIPKRNGRGTRELAIPSDTLKELQRLILRRIVGGAAVLSVVHGSVPGRSIKTHAAVHRDAQALYVLDLADAFTQATRGRVVAAFEQLRWSGVEAAYLADLTTFDDSLPQGAPTSNMLWNAVCYRLDLRILDVAEAHRLIYTRYTDELVFSHAQHIPHEVRLAVRQAVRDAGFVINPRKVHYFHARCGALPVTGVSIVNGRLKLTKRRVEWLRALIHCATKDSRIPREYIEGTLGQVRLLYGRQRYRLPRRLRYTYERFLASRQLLR